MNSPNKTSNNKAKKPLSFKYYWYWDIIYQITNTHPQYKFIIFFIEWLFYPLIIILPKALYGKDEMPWSIIILMLFCFFLFYLLKITIYNAYKKEAMGYLEEYYKENQEKL